MIVDFPGVPAGTEVYMMNKGPDEPFAAACPATDFEPSDPGTTGQVMRFDVVPRDVDRTRAPRPSS